jgi:hypothetical protein
LTDNDRYCRPPGRDDCTAEAIAEIPLVTAAIAPLTPPFDDAAAALVAGSSGTGSFSASEIAFVNAGKALFMISVGLVFAARIWTISGIYRKT